MQNVKGIGLKKFFSVVTFLTCLLVMPLVCMAEGADVMPQVFVGNAPAPIVIERGMPVEVPVFFVGGTCVDKEVELYVFRVDTEENVFCFGPEGWESDYAMALEDYKPLCNVPGLPEYIYLRWKAFEDSQSLSDFDLWVCVDDQIDGVPTENSIYCGHQLIMIDDNSTGTGDDSGTGDDTGSGSDDGSGGGGFQLPPPPPFPTFGGNSGGSCNSLKFTPEGTTFSYDSIGKSLELGASERIILHTTACGDSVTVSSVKKTSGGEWLSASASSGGGSKVILDLDAGSGVQAGSSYTGTVEVDAGGITDNLSVTLRVLGECNATSALVYPSSLSFQAHVGQNPGAQTFRVKDDCGHAVSATVVSKPDWLTVTETGTGTGVFSVSCKDSYLQEVYSDSDTITLTDDEYSQRHSVSVSLKVTEASSTSSDGRVTTVISGHRGNYDVGAYQTRYFKFVAGVPNCQSPIQVSSTPQSTEPRTVHVLVKLGSKPTIADFERTWGMSQSQSGTGGLYWNYNVGSQSETILIKEPMDPQDFFIMLYNNGTQAVHGQWLEVHYYN